MRRPYVLVVDPPYAPDGCELVRWVAFGPEEPVKRWAVIAEGTLEDMAAQWAVEPGRSLLRRIAPGWVEGVTAGEYDEASASVSVRRVGPLTGVGREYERLRLEVDEAWGALRERFLAGEFPVEEYDRLCRAAQHVETFPARVL